MTFLKSYKGVLIAQGYNLKAEKKRQKVAKDG